MSEYKNLVLEKKDKTLIIYLNKPEKLNSLHTSLLDELESVLLNDIKKDNEAEGFIITGMGEKAFSAGADISELAKLTGPEGFNYARKGQKILEEIENCGKVSIAAINGVAFGGGLELALSCTFRFAVENIKIGQPEVKLGIIPGFGGTQRLVRLIGISKAAELILTGEPIDAKKAYELGIVNKIVNKENLLQESINYLKKIYSNGPISVKYGLLSLNYGRNISLNDAMVLEAIFFANSISTIDAHEGLNAFLQKRRAEFKNK